MCRALLVACCSRGLGGVRCVSCVVVCLLCVVVCLICVVMVCGVCWLVCIEHVVLFAVWGVLFVDCC